MSLINSIHTPCKSCVFAIYDNITQTGCAVSYLDKYRSKGADILEVYDDEKEFFVINDKKCIGYRENKWFNKYELEHATIEEKIEKFQSTNHIDYLMVIDLKSFSDKELNDLTDALSMVEHKPNKTIFIRYQNDKNFPYEKIKKFFDTTKINCKWRIQTMLDDSLSQKDTLHNITNLNKGYRFILWINKPVSVADSISDIVNKANNIVYEELDPIVAIKNRESSAILFSAASYRWSIIVEKTDILESEKNYIVV